MESEFAVLIQRLEAFHVAVVEAALAASELEELLSSSDGPADAGPADAGPADAGSAMPPAWKVDGTRVQTAPGEPWINVYDAIKLALEPLQTLEVPTDAHVESCATDST
jgi:hypothetical protein